ncbi:LOW QUALITY PROTEIN: hypothetical protein BT93_G0880 [Corymbia citriodora subsp. variegata]|nr:LOW QUALITY PROTEIN: hypothetical protein BT93_G0880 [Corymbia citriodora subsp. variegata]
MGKVAGSKRDYEEERRQRMEENKKRMEELRLNKLAAALLATSPKSNPVKQSKMKTPRKHLSPVLRTANKPAPNYKEVHVIDPSERVRRSYPSHSRRDLLNRVYASDAIRTYAIERAAQLQSSLDAEYPSFIKPMLQSHVTGGFWLSLQHNFCHKHLPHHDDTVTLVDEDGEEFETKYLIDKNGLSGGWRGFSIAHDLVDGDALVFQLIKPLTFKVHIVRAYESEEKEAEAADEEEEAAEDHEEEEKEVEDRKEEKREAAVKYLTRSAKRIRATRFNELIRASLVAEQNAIGQAKQVISLVRSNELVRASLVAKQDVIGQPSHRDLTNYYDVLTALGRKRNQTAIYDVIDAQLNKKQGIKWNPSN